ncbi:MAG: transposase [Coleofasciculaceae cyanobacterium]
MKAYSIDLRSKILKAYEEGNTSVRKVASRFKVSKSFVQKLLLMKKTQGHVQPKQQGGSLKSQLDGAQSQLAAMVEKYPDATLSEYCEYWGRSFNHWVSTSRGLSSNCTENHVKAKANAVQGFQTLLNVD